MADLEAATEPDQRAVNSSFQENVFSQPTSAFVALTLSFHHLAEQAGHLPSRCFGGDSSVQCRQAGLDLYPALFCIYLLYDLCEVWLL